MADRATRGDLPTRSPTEVMFHIEAGDLSGTTAEGAVVPAETCRRLLCDAGVVPVLGDGTGKTPGCRSEDANDSDCDSASHGHGAMAAVSFLDADIESSMDTICMPLGTWRRDQTREPDQCLPEPTIARFTRVASRYR